MVNEDKLEQWVRSKLEAGVSEERIRESLENTGHDPSIVDQVQDPFDGGEDETVEETSESETSQPEQDPYSKREPEQAGNERLEASGNQRDQRDQDNVDKRGDARESERERKRQERSESWEENDDRQDPSSEPKIDNVEDQNVKDRDRQRKDKVPREDQPERPFRNQPESDRKREPASEEPGRDHARIDREELQSGRGTEPDEGPSTPGAPKGKPERTNGSRKDDTGLSLSLPEMAEREKHIAGAAFVLLVLVGLGFAGVSHGVMDFDELNLASSGPDEPETSPIAGMDSNCDVGVRVESARAVDGTTEVSLRMFRGEAPAYLRLYDSGQVIEEQEFVMSGTQTKSFNTVGERVEFGPVGCNFEDELRVS